MKCRSFSKLTNLFKVLSDPNRQSLIAHLSGCREANVGELSKCCEIDLSVVSRHLSKLRDAGILGANKKGKEVFYDLKASELAKMLRDLADEIEASASSSEK
ncbi:MAG: transcriptional regulator [Bdellovibrio sp. CG12_big_fil_rev_8_21_14_0_65_39_13]|nr:MAG: transcriptional regulator [Bdellovibrio sp. CG22_combo_CG10-13_8_21_14_all_39_27]PIQ60346.1 MAG: transcriptional regulator [Bdellovibrio sp. CG12_big_fil_rev_8_21_14_0_65_39_13]PIR35044.1 MAG: transcriptional regulator [Bdellovibrio sp. CG11_big_fil_rev_8_21_14_0_20_39_38]